MYHIEVGYDTVNGVELVRAYFMNALLNLQHLEQGISWPVECYINFLRKTLYLGVNCLQHSHTAHSNIITVFTLMLLYKNFFCFWNDGTILMIYLRCDIAGGVKVLTWVPEQAVLLVLGSHSQKYIQCDHYWPITRTREAWHWTDSWNMRTRTLHHLQCELWGSWSRAGWNIPWEEQSSKWLPQEVLSNCCDRFPD